MYDKINQEEKSNELVKPETNKLTEMTKWQKIKWKRLVNEHKNSENAIVNVCGESTIWFLFNRHSCRYEYHYECIVCIYVENRWTHSKCYVHAKQSQMPRLQLKFYTSVVHVLDVSYQCNDIRWGSKNLWTR